jgi:hypothetical protein
LIVVLSVVLWLLVIDLGKSVDGQTGVPGSATPSDMTAP